MNTWRRARKSSHSAPNSDCLEAGELADGMRGIRDTKDPDGPYLAVTRSAFRAFVLGAKAGEFDDLV